MQCDEEISTIIIRPGCSGRDAEDHDSNDKDDNALLSEWPQLRCDEDDYDDDRSYDDDLVNNCSVPIGLIFYRESAS